MAEKIIALIKISLQATKATPAPPIGPALGQHGINIAEFCKEYIYIYAKNRLCKSKNNGRFT